ncbi:response regulator [Acuticoccus sp. MNP-M23]|uniref:response regulator n=1 Tax=Acuticoccus sp. MNP-M23 TaxID=3072793 RepID=UPI002815A480|nr:response regulator [Acuticoccus sp. MNP-M23]WMS43013.1 response regulator [Acuticoccus sp. MNP-M23]
MADAANLSVIIVDDEFLIARMMQYACEDIGMNVLCLCHGAQEAIDALTEHKPDVVLLDVRLDDTLDGVDVAQRIVAAQLGTKIIFATGSTEPQTTARMRAVGPHAILNKPIYGEMVCEAVLHGKSSYLAMHENTARPGNESDMTI